MDINHYFTKVHLLLAQYRKYYPMYKIGTDVENDNLFQTTEMNLSDTYKDMFLSENRLSKIISNQQSVIARYSKAIRKDKDKLIKLRKEYKGIQNVANASEPLLHQKDELKRIEDEKTSYLLSAGILVLYFLAEAFSLGTREQRMQRAWDELFANV